MSVKYPLVLRIVRNMLIRFDIVCFWQGSQQGEPGMHMIDLMLIIPTRSFLARTVSFYIKVVNGCGFEILNPFCPVYPFLSISISLEIK